MAQLTKDSWNGIPDNFRAMTWKLLMGYMPMNKERQEAVLTRKRNDYWGYVGQTFGKGIEKLDQVIWHQV